ncbi:hypothetical protein RN001_012615 [Aquatica leii]|uniref:Major facilitator superfamily (MFS) profile domain-containing protein n=1 Tax=Aquatica leii TaxID=1421715 RepID=A0AAN7SMJ0_9COLE|nr:hypothetical protein RN001_012615 [Aquatica leii]
MSQSDGYSTDDGKRKREVHDEKESIAKSQKMHKSPAKSQQNEEKLDQILNLLHNLTLEVNQIRAEQLNMVALCAGMQIAWSSPSLAKLQSEELLDENVLGRTITNDEASWIGSLLPVGGCIGTKISEYFVDKIGRKKSIFVSSILPFSLTYVLFLTAFDVHQFYVARFLAGIAVSGVFTILPLYLAEIAEDCNRGSICCSMVAFQALGHVITYTTGYYLSITVFAYFCLIVVLITGTLVTVLIPESPYYLVAIKKNNLAEKALIKLRSTIGRGISNELTLITQIVEEYQEGLGSMIDIFSIKALRRAQIIGLSLITFQTLSGISPILFYAQDIFKEAGTTLEPALCVVILGLVQLCISSITPHLVDKFGRRPMLFSSAVGMFLGDMSLCVYFFLKQFEHDTHLHMKWIPIPALIIYIVSYFIGFGPLVYTVMAEVFPNEVKASAASLVINVSWNNTLFEIQISEINTTLNMVKTLTKELEGASSDSVYKRLKSRIAHATGRILRLILPEEQSAVKNKLYADANLEDSVTSPETANVLSLFLTLHP